MRVELVCVGTELLTSKVSTHSTGLAERLESLGLHLSRETVVGDDPAEMAVVFREAWRRSDLILCSGGLGPTFDDITREIWSKVLRRKLLFRAPLFRDVQERFLRSGLRMAPENRRQAFILSGAEPLRNPNGTAPGQRLTIGRKTLCLLPGPGKELFPMFDESLVPWLRSSALGVTRETRVWRLFGSPESAVDHDVRPIVAAFSSWKGVSMIWGILAHQGLVDVKVTAAGKDGVSVRRCLSRVEALVRRTFGTLIFGTDKDVLEGVVGGLLTARGETVATAESCTGGGLAERLTRTGGSSLYFVEGRVTYHNRSKEALLGVPSSVLTGEGAVSRRCARAMAEGLRRRAKTTWALSITGIAGPGGGTPLKPVGLVFIGLAGPRGTRVWEHRFSGDRGRIREQSGLWALDHLRRSLRQNRKMGNGKQ
jgi:nicotinamide-nucleotide amidase